MSDPKSPTKSILTYVSLSDEYERKARFIPGMLTVVMVLPAAIALGVPLKHWIAALLTGVGLSAILAVGISHVASALGNRFQQLLWPRWPFDSPTSQRLLPKEPSHSQQQKKQWYSAIKRLTSLDIAAAIADESGLQAIINDALSQIRTRLWKSPLADRLRMHNAEYGFARNFAGLRALWLPATTIVAVACWGAFFCCHADLSSTMAATFVAVLGYPLAFVILPDYVRQKAEHYADSFFDAILSLDRSLSASTTKDHMLGS